MKDVKDCAHSHFVHTCFPVTDDVRVNIFHVSASIFFDT